MKNLFILLLVFLFIAGKSQTVIPQKAIGSKFSLTFANLYFEVDSAMGARVTSFKLNDNELMYIDFKTTNNAGSTFWPSPQSIWNWPPPVNLDSNPFKTSLTQDKIVFKGNTDAKTMLRFYKTIFANTADSSIIIDYCIKNEKTVAQKWAPWEITRVLNSGLSIFAKGQGNVTGDMAGRTQSVSDYVWYDQDYTKGDAGSKFFSDGQGWLAHVIDGNMLFIKKFVDTPYGKAAPAEAEIEVYTAPDNSYTELEDQGVYSTIAAKDSLTWRVKWYARELPVSVDVSVGSASLTNYIQSVLMREAPVTSVEISKTEIAKVYPNPATGLLTVETGLTSTRNIMLRIIDLQGRIVLSHSMSQSKEQIHVENLQQGIYIYDLKQGNETLNKGKIAINQ